MRILLASLAVLASAGAAQAHEVKAGSLTLSSLAVRASLGAVPTSAAYLTITNAGKRPDRLLSVDCACAAMAMVHESKVVNGISSMAMVDAVTIPAGGRVEFKPEGLHIMLTGVKTPLKAGGMQEMVLTFAHAGAVRAGFHVKDVIRSSTGK